MSIGPTGCSYHGTLVRVVAVSDKKAASFIFIFWLIVLGTVVKMTVFFQALAVVLSTSISSHDASRASSEGCVSEERPEGESLAEIRTAPNCRIEQPPVRHSRVRFPRILRCPFLHAC